MNLARQQFLSDYQRIRSAEGRGAGTSEYYRALPFQDLSGRNSWQWHMRARTFRYFADKLLPKHPCDILDLGAGNCWLSYRLRERGHRPVAVDIFSDAMDGLRAVRHYPESFPAVEADFDSLPFPNNRFDLILYNASIHYSADYSRTLREARRCLRPGGRFLILDSPMYARREHGEQMKSERQAQFQNQYGFRSEALGSIEYFDRAMLQELSAELRVCWTIYRPWYGWRWHLRPLQARWKGKRPPSSFWILQGTFA
jgi:ubiquinone/menaquinone biosynthesis C-methylase UbiE